MGTRGGIAIDVYWPARVRALFGETLFAHNQSASTAWAEGRRSSTGWGHAVWAQHKCQRCLDIARV
eukprot:818908-Pyramimonas_sp.AAC.1